MTAGTTHDAPRDERIEQDSMALDILATAHAPASIEFEAVSRDPAAIENSDREDEDHVEPTARQSAPKWARTLAKNREQEPGLIAAWREQGDSRALDTILRRYRGFIRSNVAKVLLRYKLGQSHFADMEQEATLCLVSAVNAFDATMGSHLSSLAYSYVRGGLIRYALDNKNPYRIGTSSQERKALFEATRERARKTRATGSEILDDRDVAEIGRRANVSQKITKRAVSALNAVVVDFEKVDIVDENATDPSGSAADRAQRSMGLLRALTEGMDPRKRAIIEFEIDNLDDPAASTRQTMAERLELTPSRIGQIRREALMELRSTLETRGLSIDDLL